MSSFPILDLVVGVVFFFFLLSVICSSIVEMILTFKRVRSEILGQWLLTIFDTPVSNGQNKTVPLGQEIMDHCAVTALSPKGKAPSYIDAKNFVSALIDKITKFSKEPNPIDISGTIKSLESTTILSDELKRSFLIYANEANDTINSLTVKTAGAIEMFRSKMENWYDSSMDRLTGTMKVNYTRKFTIATAIVVSLAVNADTIEISKYLYSNPEARVKVAARALDMSTNVSIKQKIDSLRNSSAKDDSTQLTLEQLQALLSEKAKTVNEASAALQESFPLGWTRQEFATNKTFADWSLFVLSKLAGMAITVIAMMTGAPFWFDVLNKISNIRGIGTKPKESEIK